MFGYSKQLIPLITILTALFPLHGFAQSDSALHAAFIQEVRETLIAQSPETTNPTRSTWGPTLYRTSVDAAVLVEIYETKENDEPKFLGHGSGVVISETGSVLTNWHVTWPHEHVVVVFYPGKGKSYKEVTADKIWLARVIRVDKQKDLALLQLEKSLSGRGIPSGMKTISLEDPKRMDVGQDVFSIGHPEGLHWTYTEGIISQIRPHYVWEASGTKHEATIIQTQTVVSYGSSGGPLINRDGRLVGIVESMSERPGLNIAISVQDLNDFLNK